MKNLRAILKNKILSELYDSSESTHYDKENNRKVKVFNDTIDFIKNIAKAEITSGKSKGLFTVVNLDNLVELNPNELGMVAEGASNVPMGAENDPNAPWNQSDDSVTVKRYFFDDAKQQFYIEMSDGSDHEVDYIDVLEKYWKSHPGSYEQHSKEFENLDDTIDAAIINKLKEEGVKFYGYLESVAEDNGWTTEEEYDDYDRYDDERD